MDSDYAATKWSIYEANVQQYRILSATIQSFLLTVGSILYTQDKVPNALLILITLLALLHIRYIWFEIVKARHLIIDYYKFQHYKKLSPQQMEELKDKYPETRYIHDIDSRIEVNTKYFNRPNLKLWRETRLKLDIIVPIGYTLIWVGLFLWKQPWHTPLW